MAEERGPAGPRFLFLGRPASPVFYNKLRTSVLSVIKEMMGTKMRARIGRIDGSLGVWCSGSILRLGRSGRRFESSHPDLGWCGAIGSAAAL